MAAFNKDLVTEQGRQRIENAIEALFFADIQVDDGSGQVKDGKATFFSTFALNMPYIADFSVPTLCTNGKWIRYNPAFIIKDKYLSATEFKVVHEAWHVALKHPWMLLNNPHLDPDLMNQAMDYLVNLMLADAGWKVPDDALLDTSFRGMDEFEIYTELEKRQQAAAKAKQEKGKSGEQGDSSDSGSSGEGSDAGENDESKSKENQSSDASGSDGGDSKDGSNAGASGGDNQQQQSGQSGKGSSEGDDQDGQDSGAESSGEQSGSESETEQGCGGSSGESEEDDSSEHDAGTTGQSGGDEDDSEDGSRDERYDHYVEKGEYNHVKDSAGHGAVVPCHEEDSGYIEEQVSVVLGQAHKIAKSHGLVPMGINEFVDGILNPKIHWSDILRQWMMEKSTDDYNWEKPDVTFIPFNVFYPSMESNSSKLTLVIDSSASVFGQMYVDFMGETFEIVDLSKDTVHVIFCDAEVQSVIELEAYDEKELIRPGYGGTRYTPAFEYVDDMLDNDINALVYFTDGECWDFPAEPPPYDVLWVLPFQPDGYWGWDPPFGETIFMSDKTARNYH